MNRSDLEHKQHEALVGVAGELRRVLALTKWQKDPAIVVSLRQADEAMAIFRGEPVEAR